LGIERKPGFYGVLACNEGEAKAVLIVWERGLHEALERAMKELSKVKERCESGHISGIMGYTPMAVPGSKRASRLALSDKEFVTKVHRDM